MGPGVSNSLAERPFCNFTDVTLADEYTNSILRGCSHISSAKFGGFQKKHVPRATFEPLTKI